MNRIAQLPIPLALFILTACSANDGPASSGTSADAALDAATEDSNDANPADVDDVDPPDVDRQDDADSGQAPVDGGPDDVAGSDVPRDDVLMDTSADAVGDSQDSDTADSDADTECVAAPADAPGLVQTSHGTVAGTLNDGVWSWKGIRFAAPPVGELRWQLPRDPECWQDVFVASEYGDLCPQHEDGEVIGNEDCLTLNVWVPDGDVPESGWPVLFFIHGGGHVQGGSGKLLPGSAGALYDGSSLARQGTVVVTINYRLGALGYLAFPELEDENGSLGNWGFYDQLKALEWTRDNISRFGGDEDRVTVFGESAGGVSTCVHVASELSTGLLDGAIIQSASCVADTLEYASTNAIARVAETSCADDDDVVACMERWSYTEVVEELPGTAGLGTPGFSTLPEKFGPVIDGVVLDRAPHEVIESGEHNHVPFIIGSNGAELEDAFIPVPDEETYEAIVRSTYRLLGPASVERILEAYPASDYGSPRDAAVALFSDAQFNCLARRNAARMARVQEDPAYHYFFTRVYESARGDVPPSHGNELPYVFGTLPNLRFTPPAAGDQYVMESIQTYWTNFARSGNPNDEGIGDWDIVTAPSGPTLRIDDPATMESDVMPDCDMWDEFYERGGL